LKNKGNSNIIAIMFIVFKTSLCACYSNLC